MTTVLVVSPHPDDESIGCGGTLLHHVAHGDRVEVIFLSSGERGMRPFDQRREREANKHTREAEARQAARILGVSEVEFWHLADGALAVNSGLIQRLRAEIDRRQASVVYTTHQHELHRDHRAAARLVRRATAQLAGVSARYFEVWTPLQQLDRLVDISEHIDTKLEAVRAHRSQCAIVAFDHAARGLARYRGELHLWPGGPYAEAFGSW